MLSAISRTRKAIIRSVTRAISYAKKTTYLSLMSFTKVIRKNTKQAESLGMKMSRQSVALLGKADSGLILTE